ncbi:YihY/virulence factor BrkB family protein [Mesorhizobium sp. M2D.F.Ca.ET.185.01.1.1]|uniref:YihY/virulence factor BrkB family protein n=4 Tax=Mesorhizobium TaxID=68287 RepID=UPI000FCC7146|nr:MULTISPECIES: YihY/virulence factor BrkB family protein [unclassified Mesorhizobium]RVD57590.1 YihY/virulence factor BrkB family protein [Mesorhizobium sp. M2D.F.Ca.ET.140.01.1.1]TGP16413.1 YihY/virulence factor BrkB family protein [Mesorhizobium sp. M2D.F.Ca.ET.233.01.1.1]TGP65227.1 YihY/virulence factor BrkB family protein [Mesorhizobium sp. M2D.F.Ca.ET.226.01.1.1]TGP71704.1 YihY/virulence factor BrkB family protein [Mesorhizobium sp. M2D.F.Ca.ET.225.01.1.1]TGP74644.1 YihY/virulence facto
MLEVWRMVKASVAGFIADSALSHGAAMAFFAVTSLGPVLLLVVAVAGLVFGHDAARDAIAGQLSGVMGTQSAEVLQTALQSASNQKSGIIATVVGLITLLLTASGVFGEMQSALNTIWRAKPEGSSITRLIRARTASLGLVVALGFLLIVSLAASAAISALSATINQLLPFGSAIVEGVNILISFLLIAVLFAAIYKVLPDRDLQWRDVWFGAFVTSALFTIGKSLIGLYIGSSAVASSFGAASALIVVLLWIYYSSLIFLLGAEFTRAYSVERGSQRGVELS